MKIGNSPREPLAADNKVPVLYCFICRDQVSTIQLMAFIFPRSNLAMKPEIHFMYKGPLVQDQGLITLESISPQEIARDASIKQLIQKNRDRG
jgi:hypothetical protein